MKLHILGTGHATVIKNYNTCFCIENNGEYFLIDGGGGNRIFSQLAKAKIDINKIQSAFITHNHTDHLLGMIWVLFVRFCKVFSKIIEHCHSRFMAAKNVWMP